MLYTQHTPVIKVLNKINENLVLFPKTNVHFLSKKYVCAYKYLSTNGCCKYLLPYKTNVSKYKYD